jgi:NAD(P)-dependent dehydrogenase (short-subunit alcohol dehydrogenase family)
MPFENATAVVTGGGSGLGRAFCAELGRARARVLIADVNAEGAEETAALVREAGGEARVATIDVADPAQVESLAAMAHDWLGDTDLLINNAGVAVSGPIGEVTLEDWKWQIDINLWGVIYGCHYFVPRMKKRRRGHVINVASAAGLLAPPQLGPYNVAKAGVVALSETLYAETKKLGIKVTVLCPTFFRTSIAESGRGIIDEKSRAAMIRLMEKSKVQAPDVARAALAACSRGRLYCLPMIDAQMSWRLKRAIPGRFYDLLSRAADQPRILKLLGAD